MPHSVFIRHTYIYKCVSCNGEWKINEAADSETLNCPHCGKRDTVHHVLKDQRDKARNRYT